MKPSYKSEEMENFITDTFGVNRKENITNNICVFCKKPATSFRNEISKREFSISGLCQKCQDEVFGVD